MAEEQGSGLVVLRCPDCGDVFPAEAEGATCPACGGSSAVPAWEPLL